MSVERRRGGGDGAARLRNFEGAEAEPSRRMAAERPRRGADSPTPAVPGLGGGWTAAPRRGHFARAGACISASTSVAAIAGTFMSGVLVAPARKDAGGGRLAGTRRYNEAPPLLAG